MNALDILCFVDKEIARQVDRTCNLGLQQEIDLTSIKDYIHDHKNEYCTKDKDLYSAIILYACEAFDSGTSMNNLMHYLNKASRASAEHAAAYEKKKKHERDIIACFQEK